jgi:sec-independent protein translocase protein TatA
MFGLGVPEIIVIGIIILLIFGAKRLPSIGEGLGKTVRELRNAQKEISSIKRSEIKKEGGESNESEEKKEIAGDETDSSDGRSSESDIIGTVQRKMTKQVTDNLLRQVPGIKQAKQLKKLKDKADNIKKIVD